MNVNHEKCVILIRKDLPAGLAANTAAVLACTLGRLKPELVGEDVRDRNGRVSPGIIRIPVPVLACENEQLESIRTELASPDLEDVGRVEFTKLAQSCRTYPEYVERMKEEDAGSLAVSGVLLFGNAGKINHLCGALPLYR